MRTLTPSLTRADTIISVIVCVIPKPYSLVQSRDNISIRWDWGLNHKRMASFFFPKDDVDLRLMPGEWLCHCVYVCVVCLHLYHCQATSKTEEKHNLFFQQCTQFITHTHAIQCTCIAGDELRLKHKNASNRGAWEGSGTVTRFDQTEEVRLEMQSNVSVCVCVCCDF